MCAKNIHSSLQQLEGKTRGDEKAKGDRLIAVTKDAIAHFDWSSFILQELYEEIQEFKKDSQKSKRKQSKTVGGCLYFLMLFCFQNFPLGDVIPSPHESPMAFWTDEKVKSRVLVEKRSKKGLLVRVKPRQPLPQASVPPLPQASVPPSTSFDPDTMLTHPVVRTTYAQLLSNLQQEMLALQHTLSEEGQHEEIPQHGEETPHVDGGLGEEQEVKELGLELWRFHRVIISSSVLKSPWIDPKRKSKGKRTYDEKDTLSEMCTKSVCEDEAAEEFVDMPSLFSHKERATMSKSTSLD
ncbi:hypothetical protein K1719_015092 [Acacia pycnantha]|nr:hypothetical protein K1719_015092 [Acacia pycnantha]